MAAKSSAFIVNPGWRLLLRDLGLRPANILRRAGLPSDLFGREKATLKTEEYFRLWQGIEDEAADPLMPLRLPEVLGVESFDPSVFAALCSPDLNVALHRIATYKRLVMPMTLRIDVAPSRTSLELDWPRAAGAPPATLVASELIFFVNLSRVATRAPISPITVTTPRCLEPKREYEKYFGVEVRQGRLPGLSFAAYDAERPFLTANEEMWKFFEPELRRRLSELDEAATTHERVRAALLELLPSGEASLTTVAKRLGTSPRTLHRRLKGEGASFQTVLNATREELAVYYLKTSSYSGAEISFLLGFEDPNSFVRAFHSWTGSTPEQTRVALQLPN